MGGEDDAFDLVGIEEVDLAGRRMPDLYLFGGEGLDILSGEEFEERPQDDGVVALGVPLEGISAPGGTSVEREAIFSYGIERNVGRLLDPGRADELVETAAIALYSPERTTHFDLEVFEEALGIFLDRACGLGKRHRRGFFSGPILCDIEQYSVLGWPLIRLELST